LSILVVSSRVSTQPAGKIRGAGAWPGTGACHDEIVSLLDRLISDGYPASSQRLIGRTHEKDHHFYVGIEIS
jgi:hypothetical protein